MKKSILPLWAATVAAAAWTAYATPIPQGANQVCRQSREVGAIVDTTTGQILGRASDLRPDVSAYLGIPFAQPPVGDLRFAAPVAMSASNGVINATAFGPDCPCNTIPTKEAALAGPAGEKILTALSQAGDVFDEDCLTLNVWTKPQTGEAKKAVLFWIYGGGFSTGNTASPVYDGAVLADEEDVVVVSANYRLNIFGFSGAPGEDTNVGLMDQRLALEWARDNIEAFGGDSSRITVFGQSAGGASVDIIAYGFPSDPIAHALIPQSGVANSVVGNEASGDQVKSNWYRASQNAGCGGEEAGEVTVSCMKSKSWQDILDDIAPIGATGLMSGFAPYADDKVLPSNISAKGEAGDFAKLPYLVGHVDDEAAFFVVVAFAYTNLTPEQSDAIPVFAIQPVLDLITLYGWTCPTAEASSFRVKQGVPVWRYRYFGGNYTNTYIKPFGSAYHTSELPVLFGTAPSVTGIPDSEVEAAAAGYMRKAWASFAKDPLHGLSSLGWPQAEDMSFSKSQVRLSYENETAASYITTLETDILCPAVRAFPNLTSELQGLLTSLSAVFLLGSPTSSQTAALEKYANLIQSPHNDVASMTAFIQGLEEVAAMLNGTATA